MCGASWGLDLEPSGASISRCLWFGSRGFPDACWLHPRSGRAHTWISFPHSMAPKTLWLLLFSGLWWPRGPSEAAQGQARAHYSPPRASPVGSRQG